MRYLGRMIATSLIVALAINLGDWPFVDELFSELLQDGLVLQSAPEAAGSAVDRADPHNVPKGVGYNSLNSFTVLSPPPDRTALTHAVRQSPYYPRTAATPAEFIRHRPFRPPVT